MAILVRERTNAGAVLLPRINGRSLGGAVIPDRAERARHRDRRTADVHDEVCPRIVDGECALAVPWGQCAYRIPVVVPFVVRLDFRA